MSEEPSISLDDFMELDEAAPSAQKKYLDEDYLKQLSTEEARNSAFVADKLGVTPATVARRLAKESVADKIFTRYQEAEPLFVLKPKSKAKAAKKKGVEL